MASSRQPKFPVGFRYVPTERELIKYLECKVTGRDLPCGGVIIDGIDIYSVENHPEKLLDRHGNGENAVYVFTKLKKVAEKGKNVERRVGDCTWKGNNKGSEVLDGQKIVGWVKSFTLRNKSNVKIGYNMKEFTLHQSLLRNAKKELKDYALCRIHKKSKEEAKSKNENFQEEVDAYVHHQNQPYPEHPDQFQVKNGFTDAVALWNSSEAAKDLVDDHGALSEGTMLKESILDSIQKPEEPANTPQLNYHQDFTWMMDMITNTSFQQDYMLLQPSEKDPFPINHQLLPIQGFSNLYSTQDQMLPLAFPTGQSLMESFGEPNAMLQAKSSCTELQDQDQYMMTSPCHNMEIESTNAAMVPFSSATLQIDERINNLDSESLLLSEGKEMEISKPVGMVPSTLMSGAVREEHSGLRAAACNQEEMCVNNGDCTEFGRELATTLRSFMKDPSVGREDSIIDNNWGLQSLGIS